MPTTKAPTSQKKEKRDFKQEFLDSIAKNYGVGNAVLMEDVLSEQKKQLQMAMHTGGMGLEDIAQSKGMNLIGDLIKNQEQVKATGEGQPQQQQPQGNLPASSPLGFGGASMQNGQMVEQNPGLLAGLLSLMVTGSSRTGAAMDTKRLSQQQGQQTQNQLGQQKLAGEEPLQKGEKEKLEIQFQQDLVKKALELEKEGNLKPNDIFNGFEQASKAFILSRDAHARVEASAKDPSAAGDLALIFNFMKVLDPGSTVREGEFASAQNSAGVPQQIRNIFNKVMSGERLAPKQRIDFLDRSRKLFKTAEEQQKKTTNQFKGLAERNGVNFKNVVRDTGISLSQQAEDNKQSSGKTSSGTIWRRIE